MLTSDDLGQDSLDLTLAEDVGGRRYDVFGTANFFNFTAFAAAVEYLLEIGIEAVEAHDQALVERFLAGLPRDGFDVLSPETGPARSTLVLISAKDEGAQPGDLREPRRRRHPRRLPRRQPAPLAPRLQHAGRHRPGAGGAQVAVGAPFCNALTPTLSRCARSARGRGSRAPTYARTLPSPAAKPWASWRRQPKLRLSRAGRVAGAAGPGVRLSAGS